MLPASLILMRTNKLKYLMFTFMFMEAVCFFPSLWDVAFCLDSNDCKSAHVRPTQHSDLCLSREVSAAAPCLFQCLNYCPSQAPQHSVPHSYSSPTWQRTRNVNYIRIVFPGQDGRILTNVNLFLNAVTCCALIKTQVLDFKGQFCLKTELKNITQH